MARCLVTGATGFIGRRLVESLSQRGHEVTCLARRSPRWAALQSLGVRVVHADVTEAGSLPTAEFQVDVVYHLAGLVTARSQRQFHDTNVRGTQNLAQACGQSDAAPVLVFVSSIAAAGPNLQHRPHREEDPCAPISRYGRSKLQAEAALCDLAGRLPISILRPPIVFGPYDQQVLKVFKSARRGWHLTPGLSPHRYSFIHVDDLVDVMQRVAQSGRRLKASSPQENPGLYYAAAEETPTWEEFGRLVGRAVGRQHVRVVRVPATACRIAACGADALARSLRRSWIFNSDKIQEATAGSWTCCSDRAREELGFAPAATFPQRLEQTAQWYQQQRIL